MKKFLFCGRPYLIIDKEDRIKLLSSSSFLVKLKLWWFKIIGKKIVPMFEVATHPTIKLSDIKERRYVIKE
jgi:hypothetical protein